jgi:hypothetical protein
MFRARATLTVALLVTVVAACTKKNPKYCSANSDCMSNDCDTRAHQCRNRDGGTDGDAGEAGDVGDARDASDADARDAVEVPFRCKGPSDCAEAGVDGPTRNCELEAGRCVECNLDPDCTTPTSPICAANVCRACKTDTECPDPKICLADGRCAKSTEVVFVEANASGCPGADGTATMPFCAVADGVARLAMGRNILVIRGQVEPLTLSTSAIDPIVVGKPTAAGEAAEILTSAGMGIAITAGNVVIRDLRVSGGGSMSKGISVTGSSTAVTLSSVTVATAGLGVQADMGTQLTIDRCTITGNKQGGILLGTLQFDITNSIIAMNGPGTDNMLGVTWGGVHITVTGGTVPAATRFLNNTVVGNKPVGFACSSNVPVTGSIVFGNASGDGAGCTITACCSNGNDPMLTTDYRLTAASTACIDQLAVTASTTHDIDGQPRPGGALSDCGADEY